MFLAYYFICGRLPWDVEFRNRLRLKYYSQNEQLKLYKELRINMYEIFLQQMNQQFTILIPQLSTDRIKNPHPLPNLIQKIQNLLNVLNFQQDSLLQKVSSTLYKSKRQVYNENPKNFEAAFAELRKKEEELMPQFQLDYSVLKKVLDWPNIYLTPDAHKYSKISQLRAKSSSKRKQNL